METAMILVTAANGNQGRLIVPRLIAAGLPVRALVRSERSADDLRAASVTDVVIGDMGDPAVIARAVAGVEKVYYVCPGVHPREREIGLAWIDAARAAGVKHYVFSSVLHAVLTDLVQHEIKRDIEEHLLSSHLEFTILQPSIYMAARRVRAALNSGALTAPWSLDRWQSPVHLGDVAEVAAKVLIESEAHGAATYELAGPDRLTAHGMAQVISEAAGRVIPAQEISADDYATFLFGDRDKAEIPHQISVVQSLHTRYSSDDFIGNPNVLTWLLERRPTSFASFVRDQVEQFSPTAP